jgi:hypothetical protein
LRPLTGAFRSAGLISSVVSNSSLLADSQNRAECLLELCIQSRNPCAPHARVGDTSSSQGSVWILVAHFESKGTSPRVLSEVRRLSLQRGSFWINETAFIKKFGKLSRYSFRFSDKCQKLSMGKSACYSPTSLQPVHKSNLNHQRRRRDTEKDQGIDVRFRSSQRTE